MNVDNIGGISVDYQCGQYRWY